MRLSATHDGPIAVVRLTGRLDGESARHLSDTIEELLREGARSIELDMAEVNYLSSAGLRVLAGKSQDLAELRGSLDVVEPSPTVRNMLEAAGLLAALVRESTATRLSKGSGRFTHWGLPGVHAHHGSYEISRYGDDGVRCRLYQAGIERFLAPVDPAGCRTVQFPARAFGIGIGAIGNRAEDVAPRLGELIAAEGVVSYLPTEGESTPDYVFTYPTRVPEAVLASGIVWEGLFSDLMRFSTLPDSDEVPLTELAEACLDMSGSDLVAIALVAEMKALVGASLRRSPALLAANRAPGTGAASLREWLSFTPEPAHQGSTALLVGIVARRPTGPLVSLLRPLDSAGHLHGHIHAAVFPYEPVPQRTVMLPELIRRLYEASTPRDILHLIHDDRGADVAGQTGLQRGVCWMARVTDVEVVP
jgi:anti-anti-sigma factor